MSEKYDKFCREFFDVIKKEKQDLQEQLDGLVSYVEEQIGVKNESWYDVDSDTYKKYVTFNNIVPDNPEWLPVYGDLNIVVERYPNSSPRNAITITVAIAKKDGGIVYGVLNQNSKNHSVDDCEFRSLDELWAKVYRSIMNISDIVIES